MHVNLTGRNRGCTGRWGVGENQSRRDPMKVAQYEVLGKRSLKASVPEETIDECWQSLRRMRDSTRL